MRGGGGGVGGFHCGEGERGFGVRKGVSVRLEKVE